MGLFLLKDNNQLTRTRHAELVTSCFFYRARLRLQPVHLALERMNGVREFGISTFLLIEGAIERGELTEPIIRKERECRKRQGAEEQK